MFETRTNQHGTINPEDISFIGVLSGRFILLISKKQTIIEIIDVII